MTAQRVVCIVGPTACHKTEASILLAKAIDGEIVSADSVAVYRGLDIGSAKPTIEERAGVPHHMIDVAEITDMDFTVARFREEARQSIDDILRRGKPPIVVGGSGLYSDAIFSDMRFSVPSDSTVRAALEDEYQWNPEAVFARLRAADPITAARLHPNDAKRVVRALEVFQISGQPFSAWNRDFESVQTQADGYQVIRFGLTMDRAALYERIDRRVDGMFDLGLQAEAFALFDRGLTPDRYPAMQSIGYAQLYEVCTGQCSLSEAREAIKRSTRHFAKRQLTWFRRNTKTKWFAADAPDSIPSIVAAWTKEIQSTE